MMSYNQSHLIKQLNTYLVAKGEPPLESMEKGLCAGLVSYWLYSKANGKEKEFFSRILQYIAEWDVKKFKSSGQRIDLDLEEFLSTVLALQNPEQLVSTVTRTDLHYIFELLASQDQKKVNPAEFNLNFIFDRAELKNIIPQLAMPNKMVRIGNSFHAIGLMFSNGVYTLYDPNDEKGPREFKDLNDLPDAIFKALTKYCNSKNFIAINFSVFDLENNEPGKYFDVNEYRENKMLNPNFRREALQHQHLFFIMASLNDYAGMELLFKHGYKYKPSSIHRADELAEAIYFHDQQKVKYLLDHNIPLNYQTDKVDNSPIPHAMRAKDSKILYMLLTHGINPNIGRQQNIKIALEQDFPEGLILLLAAGMSLEANDLATIKAKYNQTTFNLIAKHAIDLHAKFINLPEAVNLDTDSGKTISALSQHVRLIAQLGHSLDNVQLTYQKELISGDKVVATLTDFYQHQAISERFNAIDKELLYQSLAHFTPDLQQHNTQELMKELTELNAMLEKIVDKIITIPIQQHSKSELLNIQLMLDRIVEIKFSLGNQDQEEPPNKAEETIRSYLSDNRVRPLPYKALGVFFSARPQPQQELEKGFVASKSFLSI